LGALAGKQKEGGLNGWRENGHRRESGMGSRFGNSGSTLAPGTATGHSSDLLLRAYLHAPSWWLPDRIDLLAPTY
jgi:hypothetical protein